MVSQFKLDQKPMDLLCLLSVKAEIKHSLTVSYIYFFTSGGFIKMSATCVSISASIELTKKSYFVWLVTTFQFLNWDSSCVNQILGVDFQKNWVSIGLPALWRFYLGFTSYSKVFGVLHRMGSP